MPNDAETHRPYRAESQSRLPVLLDLPAGRRWNERSLPRAAFISQLIAERQHLPTQRQRRRSTVDVALDAYGATERNAVLRMPPGYRKTLVV
jgi:hypothetical protein